MEEKNVKIAHSALTYQPSPIRVSVPASVAFNPTAFGRTLGDLMEKLGCPKCFSGFDCRFSLLRDYLVDPQGKVQSLDLSASRQDKLPVVNVSVGKDVAFDIKRIQGLAKELSGKFGCLPCHSGFDFTFRNKIREFQVG